MTVFRRTCCDRIGDAFTTSKKVKIRDEKEINLFIEKEDGLQVFDTKRIVYDCPKCGAIKQAAVMQDNNLEDVPKAFIREDGRVVKND